jgi:hypothetical protein
MPLIHSHAASHFHSFYSAEISMLKVKRFFVKNQSQFSSH